MSFAIESVSVSVYTVPTDRPESDGTLEWKATTMVMVRVRAGGKEGLGYTYGEAAAAGIVSRVLGPVVCGRDAMDVERIWMSMVGRIRNEGSYGLSMMAVSAVDMALWDLKAKLLGLPLCRLLGQVREAMDIYGSGGFTSYTEKELREQLGGWAEQGLGAVKMKVGREQGLDARRVCAARDAIGSRVGLYVDANGAYTVSQAVALSEQFAEYRVDWLEEPVRAELLEQLRMIRLRVRPGMRVVVGEYGYTLNDFRVLLEAGAADVLQADATRCGGITGFIKAGHLCESYGVPLSSHCAPAAHLHAAVSSGAFLIGEYFHDHVRIEGMFFEGAGVLRDGQLFPDVSRPGLGLVFKEQDASRWQVG